MTTDNQKEAEPEIIEQPNQANQLNQANQPANHTGRLIITMLAFASITCTFLDWIQVDIDAVIFELHDSYRLFRVAELVYDAGEIMKMDDVIYGAEICTICLFACAILWTIALTLLWTRAKHYKGILFFAPVVNMAIGIAAIYGLSNLNSRIVAEIETLIDLEEGIAIVSATNFLYLAVGFSFLTLCVAIICGMKRWNSEEEAA